MNRPVGRVPFPLGSGGWSARRKPARFGPVGGPLATLSASVIVATLTCAGVLLGQERDAPTAARGNHGKTIAIRVWSLKPDESAEPSRVRYGLTRNDYHYIAQFPNVRHAVPIREVIKEARYGDRLAEVRLIGTTPAFAELHPIRVVRGRFLVDRDVKTLNNLAVISSRTVTAMFPDEDHVGKSIRIDSIYFLVVGEVLGIPARRNDVGTDPPGTTQLDVYVPLSTMRARMGDFHLTLARESFERADFQLSRIDITVDDPAKTRITAARIRRLLQEFHEDVDYAVEVVR